MWCSTDWYIGIGISKWHAPPLLILLSRKWIQQVPRKYSCLFTKILDAITQNTVLTIQGLCSAHCNSRVLNLTRIEPGVVIIIIMPFCNEITFKSSDDEKTSIIVSQLNVRPKHVIDVRTSYLTADKLPILNPTTHEYRENKTLWIIK